MKVLIISSTPWNNANSFGNTFSNLFEGMENVEIYNIACRHGVSSNSIVSKAVQLTDKSVLKSIYKWGYAAGLRRSSSRASISRRHQNPRSSHLHQATMIS